ncbi:MAG TPA: ABC transporter permease subunit [Bellilinea sp.]|nr:ABC transporter permease subunit [Bellilinea sp.]
MMTALTKEWLEQRRTHRLLIVSLVFLLFGLTSPLLAKFTPEMIKMIPGGEQISLIIPPPTVIDAVTQYLKNMTQFGMILAVLMGMGMVSQEKDKGTAAMVLAKPLSRTAFILAKPAALAITFLIGTALAAVAGYYYTLLLFETLPVGGWLALNGLLLVYFGVYAALAVLASTLNRSSLSSGLTAFGFVILLVLIEIIPAAKDLLTGGLLGWAGNLALGAGGEPAWGALAVCLGLIVAALTASVLIFRRQEI